MGSYDPALHTTWWKRARLVVLIRDNYRCYICGGPARTVDHIVSRHAGGTHALSNLAACCATHNYAKGNRAPAVPIPSRVW
jgi:5-methylcytosine-specific restriction endonuclease McrA